MLGLLGLRDPRAFRGFIFTQHGKTSGNAGLFGAICVQAELALVLLTI